MWLLAYMSGPVHCLPYACTWSRQLFHRWRLTDVLNAVKSLPECLIALLFLMLRSGVHQYLFSVLRKSVKLGLLVERAVFSWCEQKQHGPTHMASSLMSTHCRSS